MNEKLSALSESTSNDQVPCEIQGPKILVRNIFSEIICPTSILVSLTSIM